MNSKKTMQWNRENVLMWLRVPQNFWNCEVLIPSLPLFKGCARENVEIVKLFMPYSIKFKPYFFSLEAGSLTSTLEPTKPGSPTLNSSSCPVASSRADRIFKSRESRVWKAMSTSIDHVPKQCPFVLPSEWLMDPLSPPWVWRCRPRWSSQSSHQA